MSLISQKILLEFLKYDPLTGNFTWRINRKGGVKAGHIAGNVFTKPLGKSYISIGIRGNSYQAHRLCFLYVLGRIPKDQVDHINGNGTDNRWENLREVTISDNCRNRRLPSNNKSGRIGVTWSNRNSMWRSDIWISGKNKYLGLFKDVEDAIQARKSAEKEHGYHPNHGQVRPL